MINENKSQFYDPRIKFTPDLANILSEVRREIFLSMNCHAIAVVKSFDPLKQTIKASMAYKKVLYQRDADTKQYKEVLVDYAPLVECPVVSLMGGTATVTMPIKEGDTCMILFNDRDIDNWYFSGNIDQAPNTPRLHSFTDGIALVGIRPSTNPIQNYDADRIVLKNDVALIAIGQAKLELSNNITSLKEILDDLITALNTAPLIAVTGAPGSPSPINPAITTLLSDLSTKIGDLLE